MYVDFVAPPRDRTIDSRQAHVRLCREKRLENSALDFFGHAYTDLCEGEVNATARALCPDQNIPARGRRIDGVENQIDQRVVEAGIGSVDRGTSARPF